MNKCLITASFTVAVLLCVTSLPARAADEPTAPVAGATEYRQPVVATVNGEIITEFDVTFALGPVDKVLPGRGPDREKQLQILRERAIQELVVTEILVQAAKRAGITVTDAMLRQEMKEKAKRAGGPASFHRLLREQGLSYAENWERIRKQLFVIEYQRKMTASRTLTKFLVPVPEIQVRPADVRAYYGRNPSEFQRQVSGLFRLIRLDPGKYPSRKAASEHAEELHKVLKAAAPAELPALFAETARKYSHDRRAAEGGAWELKDEVEIAPELHSVVLALAPGEISRVVPVEFGFFIAYIEKPRRVETLSFEQVRGEIEEHLRNEKWRARIEEENLVLLKEARIWPESVARAVKGEK